MDQQMHELESAIKAIAEYVKSQVSEIREQMLTKQEFQHMKEGIGGEKKIKELEKSQHELDEKLKELRAILSKKSVKGKGKLVIDAHIKRLEELEKRIEKEEKSFSAMTETVSHLRKENEDMRKGSHTASEPSSHEIEEIKKEIASIMESPTHAGSEPNQGKELMLVKMELEALQRTVGEMHTSLERLKELKGLNVYEDMLEDVGDIRTTVDDESARRVSVEKDMQDIRQKVNDMTTEVGKLRGLEGVDFATLMNISKNEKKFDYDLEKRVEMHASKFVTKELSEFSRMLDKRLPNVATKDDIAKIEARISTRKPQQYTPYKQARPDQALDDRLAMLESRVSVLLEQLRDTKNNHRHPFVVD
jgi:DNA repair exonuclease SbcCD ATPase subunit